MEATASTVAARQAPIRPAGRTRPGAGVASVSRGVVAEQGFERAPSGASITHGPFAVVFAVASSRMRPLGQGQSHARTTGSGSVASYHLSRAVTVGRVATALSRRPGGPTSSPSALWWARTRGT